MLQMEVIRSRPRLQGTPSVLPAALRRWIMQISAESTLQHPDRLLSLQLWQDQEHQVSSTGPPLQRLSSHPAALPLMEQTSMWRIPATMPFVRSVSPHYK